MFTFLLILILLPSLVLRLLNFLLGRPTQFPSDSIGFEAPLTSSAPDPELEHEEVPGPDSSNAQIFCSTLNLKYVVFLSFRGETRLNFTDNLYYALNRKGILTFRDAENLTKGESIRPQLFKAIEESRFAVIVFSKTMLPQLGVWMSWPYGTAIKELQIAIQHFSGLNLLDLRGCENLSNLPNALCALTSLKHLYLSGCPRIERLPQNLGRLEHSEEIDFSETAITELPTSLVPLKNLKRFHGSKDMLTALPREDTTGCSESLHQQRWYPHRPCLT